MRSKTMTCVCRSPGTCRLRGQPDIEQVVREASPDIQSIFASAVLPGGANFVSEQVTPRHATWHLARAATSVRDYFTRPVAAIVFPATMAPPPLIGETVTWTLVAGKVPFFTVVGRNIAPGSTAGLPGWFCGRPDAHGVACRYRV